MCLHTLVAMFFLFLLLLICSLSPFIYTSPSLFLFFLHFYSHISPFTQFILVCLPCFRSFSLPYLLSPKLPSSSHFIHYLPSLSSLLSCLRPFSSSIHPCMPSLFLRSFFLPYLLPPNLPSSSHFIYYLPSPSILLLCLPPPFIHTTMLFCVLACLPPPSFH